MNIFYQKSISQKNLTKTIYQDSSVWLQIFIKNNLIQININKLTDLVYNADTKFDDLGLVKDFQIFLKTQIE